MSRPPLWSTPDELQAEVDAYFVSVKDEQLARPLASVIPTVNGLCLALGCHRDSINEYSRKPEFSDIIKTAMTRLGVEWESRLGGSNSTGAIFWLKNQGWKDTQTIAGDPENPLNVNHGLSESTQSLIDSITSR